jgi:hypothetical protein
MTKHEMDMDAYQEQMFERRANGIETCSFAEWKRRNKAMRAFIESRSYARHVEREIDLARGK